MCFPGNKQKRQTELLSFSPIPHKPSHKQHEETARWLAGPKHPTRKTRVGEWTTA